MRIFHSGGYLVWIFETAHCDSFTLKLLIPQTDAETHALPDCMGKVKQRMHGGCCYAVGTLVINRGAGGSGT
jgi:hypothetical protein